MKLMTARNEATQRAARTRFPAKRSSVFSEAIKISLVAMIYAFDTNMKCCPISIKRVQHASCEYVRSVSCDTLSKNAPNHRHSEVIVRHADNVMCGAKCQ